MTSYSFASNNGAGPKYFTVQATGLYDIVGYGGQGGYGGYSKTPGGKGAETGGTFSLTQGEKLKIIVGTKGGGGGGDYGGGGGGGTFVLGNTGSGYKLLLVAGGGGGAITTTPPPGGYSAAIDKGNGQGGAGGSYIDTAANSEKGDGFDGGGGAGFKGPGQDGAGKFSGSGAASYTSRGAGSATPYGDGTIYGGGGYGGGGGGAYSAGGGGGGYTGGAGGSAFGQNPGKGGTSYDAGTPITASTIANENGGDGKVLITTNAVCFVSGTGIRVVRAGVVVDVAVENVRVGDHAVTSSGALRPIQWIGHRTIDGAPPIRIAAHAFGAELPARDLYLSPGHPVLVGADDESGHLVPIMCLVNGTTVRRVAMDRVTYWHVELDAHDILLAEGLPAESYFDLGSRLWFGGADGALYDPDLALPGMPGRCRPVAIDGPVVEAERRRLDAVFAATLARAAAWPSYSERICGSAELGCHGLRS